MKTFSGKVVVVTGGTDGIGLATAKAFVAEGARVFITGRRQDRLDGVVRELGTSVVGVQGDVSNNEDLDRLFQRIRETAERIDVLVANAGISETVPLEEINEEHFDRVFGANVKGMVFTMQKALPLMKAGANVILLGSASGSKGIAGLTVYNATKAAIRSLARTWTGELKDRGIRVNVLSPGMIHTPSMARFLTKHSDMEDALKSMTPLGRLGEPEEIAASALFLASDASRFIAGVELFVDGGVMAV